MTGLLSAEPIETARQMLDLNVDDLWIDYIALGGNLHPADLRRCLHGDYQLEAREYDRLAQAVNEHFLDRGGDHPVAYADERQ